MLHPTRIDEVHTVLFINFPGDAFDNEINRIIACTHSYEVDNVVYGSQVIDIKTLGTAGVVVCIQFPPEEE